MKRFVCSAVVMCTLSVPVAAQAQDVIPMGWTADGNAVVYVSDPLSGGDAFEWSKAGDGVAESFYAVCPPAPVGAAAWNQGCTVCIRDASAETARPADCGLTDEKWPTKKIKAANKSPSKKIAVKTKRTCTGKGDEKACKTAVTVGKVGSVTIDEASPKHKAVVSAYFRKDSGAVLIISVEESASDQAIHMHSMVVIDLTPPSESATSAYVKKWQKLADKVCACKNLKCLEKLQAQLTEIAATAEQDTAGISPEDAEQLAKEVERMTTCATAIIEKGK